MEDEEKITTETTTKLPSSLRKASVSPDTLKLKEIAKEMAQPGPQSELSRKIRSREAERIKEKRREELDKMGIKRRGPSTSK